jgi:large subunit ribosomal protein L7/L12
MPTPKTVYHDITIRLPNLERPLDHLVDIANRIVSIIAAGERLFELWYQTKQQLVHYELENAKIAYESNLASLREMNQARYEQLKAEGKLFDVWLMRCGPQKIQVIKAIREITNLGLKEAKDISDMAPHFVKQGVDAEEADRIIRKISEACGVAEARPSR